MSLSQTFAQLEWRRGYLLPGRYLPAGGWRFSLAARLNPCWGAKKTQNKTNNHSGLGCHDPHILETWPAGRSAPVREFLMPVEPFPHISIANRLSSSTRLLLWRSFSFEAGERLLWQDWKHNEGFCSDSISLPTQLNQSFPIFRNTLHTSSYMYS